MTQQRRQLGAEGEERAAAHLARRGYRILERNARAGGVEIDLVVARGGLVVFVEVKTRRAGGFGGALEAVDRRKQARLVAGARAWLQGRGQRFARARFDVVACWKDRQGGWRLDHVEEAFHAEG